MNKSLWMLAAAFFFASMAALTKAGAKEFGIFELVFYRSIVGMLAIWVWQAAKGYSVRTPYLFSHIKRSGFGTFSLCIWFYAISALPLGTAMTMNYTSPLYMSAILFVGALLKGKKPNWGLMAAVIAGFIGVLLVLKPEINRGQLFPALVGLTSGVFAALAYLQVRELNQMKEPEWRIVFYFTLCCTVTSLVVHILWVGTFTPVTLDNLPILGGLALTGTLAQLSMTRAWGGANPLLTSVFQYSGIIFAASFGALFFDEPIGLQSAVGIAVILVAGVVAGALSRKKA